MKVPTERLAGEVAHVKQDKIRLYDGDKRTEYENGVLEVTSHRLIWRRDGLVLWLSLSHVQRVELEEGGFMKSDKIVVHLLAMATTSHQQQPWAKIAAKASLQDLLQYIRSSLAAKKWAAPEVRLPVKKEIRSGIAGIEKKLQQKSEADSKNISKAFQDLDRLMEMAKPMVQLANSIATKIRERQGEISEDETVQFKSYLLSLGIEDPITKTAAGSERKYYQELAKEMFLILDQPIQEAGGMMTLTDAFVRVNRARGLELVSPDDVLHACKVLKETNLPMSLHTFPSGVMVLRSWTKTPEELVERTVYLVEAYGSLTAEQLAVELASSVLLAGERLAAAAEAGRIVLDRSISGLAYFPNRFLSEAAA